jgi:hypothetical protein
MIKRPVHAFQQDVEIHFTDPHFFFTDPHFFSFFLCALKISLRITILFAYFESHLMSKC